MVAIARGGQSEQRLKQAMYMGSRKQVAAPDDVRNTHPGIVDRGGQMIAGGCVLAREDHVASAQRIGCDRANVQILPDKRPCKRGGPCHIDTPSMRLFLNPPPALRFAQAAAGAGIMRTIGPMRRGKAGGDFGRDLRAGTETGIDQPFPLQLFQHRFVYFQPPGLKNQRPIPADAQPAQIFQYSLDMFGAAAGAVDIFNTKAKLTACGAGQIMRHQRGPAMSQMQPPCRTGREASHKMLRAIARIHADS